MKILLDTNILILRENNHIIPDNVAQLMNLLNGLEPILSEKDKNSPLLKDSDCNFE